MEASENHKAGTLLVDAETQRRVEALAKCNGVTSADVVRKAIERYEAEQQGAEQEGPSTDDADDETLYDRWSRQGFIGAVDDPNLPIDLSTNQKYFEGFGRE